MVADTWKVDDSSWVIVLLPRGPRGLNSGHQACWGSTFTLSHLTGPNLVLITFSLHEPELNKHLKHTLRTKESRWTPSLRSSTWTKPPAITNLLTENWEDSASMSEGIAAVSSENDKQCVRRESQTNKQTVARTWCPPELSLTETKQWMGVTPRL